MIGTARAADVTTSRGELEWGSDGKPIAKAVVIEWIKVRPPPWRRLRRPRRGLGEGGERSKTEAGEEACEGGGVCGSRGAARSSC